MLLTPNDEVFIRCSVESELLVLVCVDLCNSNEKQVDKFVVCRY